MSGKSLILPQRTNTTGVYPGIRDQITKKEHTIHQQNINVLTKEIHKFENNLSPPLIDDMFQVRKINYNLRHFQKFANTKKAQ